MNSRQSPKSLLRGHPGERAAGGSGIHPGERAGPGPGGPLDLGVCSRQQNKKLPRPRHGVGGFAPARLQPGRGQRAEIHSSESEHEERKKEADPDGSLTSKTSLDKSTFKENQDRPGKLLEPPEAWRLEKI